MEPQHTGDLLKHLEKQNELLKEAHKTMSQELQTLMVEEEMMMHKLCELMVTHRKNKEMKKTENLLEGKESDEASVIKPLKVYIRKKRFKKRAEEGDELSKKHVDEGNDL